MIARVRVYRVARNVVTGKYVAQYTYRYTTWWARLLFSPIGEGPTWHALMSANGYFYDTAEEAHRAVKDRQHDDAAESDDALMTVEVDGLSSRAHQQLNLAQRMAYGTALFGKRWADPGFRTRVETAAAFDELQEEQVLKCTLCDAPLRPDTPSGGCTNPACANYIKYGTWNGHRWSGNGTVPPPPPLRRGSNGPPPGMRPAPPPPPPPPSRKIKF